MQPDPQPPPQFDPPSSSMPADLKHSGVGIASFVIALATPIIFGALVTVIAVTAVRAKGDHHGAMPGIVLASMVLVGSLALPLVALALGIVGCCQQNRKRIFPILGLVFSAMTIVCGLGMMLMGAITRHS